MQDLARLMIKDALAGSSPQTLEGRHIGARIIASGELVFTTGMVGYSEALTDPSYFGQILVFSYPLIGNYGIPSATVPVSTSSHHMFPIGFESEKIYASGVIMCADSKEAHHWQSVSNLDTWLREQGVPGVVGIDTRYLVQWISGQRGDVPSKLARIMPEGAQSLRNLPKFPHDQDFFDPSGHVLWDDVSTKEPKLFGKGDKRVCIIDCGTKWNIIRQLIDLGCEVLLINWRTDPAHIDCDGFLLSNGPGDPTLAIPLIAHCKKLYEQERPIQGICLGHQIMALAAGFTTERMGYGHRSHNQPVYDVSQKYSKRGYITSQNHGFTVVSKNIPNDWMITFVNANDQTVEGIAHRHKPYSSVQFHPESAGGPRDTSFILAAFVERLNKR